ncbi:hypothetical protein Sjap_007960 [Stephania japonica]|uniref:Protein MON2 homolog n=1 Tax=Stephania japonica TaxID=461633 RepID=A0AAP0PE12_9MAGN
MAFMAVLESDLRALSAEARRRYPAIKDGAEHAILKLRSLSSPSEIAHNEDVLRIFLMACEVKSVKLSVIGLSCLQKLISHDAVAPSALKEILSTLKEHAEMGDEIAQLKTLQTILIIFQSRLHPENEENMAQALLICLRLLENNRYSDSVHNTAAATFRQAVALIFDRVVRAESLPIGKMGSGSHTFRSNSVSGDVNRSINLSESLEIEFISGGPSIKRESLTKAGKLGLRLLEDLTALAAGGSATWLRVSSLQRTFVLDILEFILSNYVAVFRTLALYEQVLQRQICSLLMTSLRTNVELEDEAGEPSFRRLVLRSVAHVIRLYCSSLVTECEVFLNVLIKVTSLDLPLWHQILVLEVLRGFCVEVRTLHLLFQNFDMHPKNTNVVEGMVKALARVVSTIQIPESSEESLAAVAGMFSSKAKGIEWSLESDASNASVIVASEAHTITLAVEGLLGVIFTVATLTDEAVDVGELESPRFDSDHAVKYAGKTALLCISMVDSLWLTILDALSLILMRSQGEAIILEILKGYQAFTQACGILRAVEPLNAFLASLCKFTINMPNESDKRRNSLPSPGSKRSEYSVDQRDNVVLTLKNVQALRTLFNIAHRLHNVLGPSWILVLETLAALDRAIHSPHATTQLLVYACIFTCVHVFLSLQTKDFNIDMKMIHQSFELCALMETNMSKSVLRAFHHSKHQDGQGGESKATLVESSRSTTRSGGCLGDIDTDVIDILSLLCYDLYVMEPLWDQVVGHLLELTDTPSQHLRTMALEALDQSISAVLGSDHFQRFRPSRNQLAENERQIKNMDAESRSFECAVISPLRLLYFSTQYLDVRAGSLKILLHVLERHGEKLHYSWPDILEMLRSVANGTEKDLISLGFQCIRVIMNDGLSTVPPHCLDICIEVTGAYSDQKTELNISLTAVGLLWNTTDFIAKGLVNTNFEGKDTEAMDDLQSIPKQEGQILGEQRNEHTGEKVNHHVPSVDVIDRDKLLFSVFSLLQKLGGDERPEVRNSAVRTLFQTLGSHGQKLSRSMWEDCLWTYVFPTLGHVSLMAATSSRDEWQGKELGTRGGKAVHMLIHHSRNTAQKQWDETLVLVLGGIARILRSFFPFLRSLNDFWTGWESLLVYVRNSILNGSKEVAIAAVNCLLTSALSHSSKGDFPAPYLKSMLDVYDCVLQRPLRCGNTAANKVKQEILHGLGELFVLAQRMFDDTMYKKYLGTIHSTIKQSQGTGDMEIDIVPPVQRTLLEILPQLRPTGHLSSMWLYFIRNLLCYLPGSEAISLGEEDGTEQCNEIQTTLTDRSPNDTTVILPDKGEVQVPRHESAVVKHTEAHLFSNLFAEKLVPLLVELFQSAPAVEKCRMLPEIIQGLGRCMTTRRDNPEAGLWRLAVEGFNHILVGNVSGENVGYGLDSSITKPARIHFWKEVADVYETFLMSSCGRALPSKALSSAAFKDDEILEMTILDFLGDKILKAETDASDDVIRRLVMTLDQCASRTCSLPIETVGLMPSHCSKFSLTCLQKLFSLCSYESHAWSTTRSSVSRISILVLIDRCNYILNKFLSDENELGENQLPSVRIEEIVYVLQELARLSIHSEVASLLSPNPHLKKSLETVEDQQSRAHLLVLFPAFCELVVSREARVRELVQVLLRLIASELGLQKARLR